MGEGGKGICYLIDIKFQICKMEIVRDLFHNNVNIFNITELSI